MSIAGTELLVTLRPVCLDGNDRGLLKLYV